jgi:tetratricopeptide (TPR) repeat protein
MKKPPISDLIIRVAGWSIYSHYKRCRMMHTRSQQSFPVRFALLLIGFAILAVSCTTAPEPKQESTKSRVPDQEELLASAQHMLRMDDYRQFDKAEFRLIALRVWRTEDIVVAGWLAQLYVAWSEQLKNEISFLRLKGAAAKYMNNPSDQKAMEMLIDYRLAKLTEVDENARFLCNTLRTYYPTHYLSHRVMADYFRVMGDREKMEPHVAIVEQINPESTGLLFLKGAVLADFDKDYIQAVDYYDQALRKDPLFVKALYFKALAYHSMGRLEVAKELMEDVLTKSPSHPGAKAYLSADAYISALTKEARQEFTDVNKDLRIKTTAPQLIYWVAQWSNETPRLLYRIGGATELDMDVRVRITLVKNDEDILQNYEQNDLIRAGMYRSFSQVFLPPVIKKTDQLDVIVQVMAKSLDASEYIIVTTQKASLPDAPKTAPGEQTTEPSQDQKVNIEEATIQEPEY